MRIRRKIGCISLVFLIVIILSAYGPKDYLGLMSKITAADSILKNGQMANVSGVIYHKEIKNNKPIYYVKNATVQVADIRLKNTSFILILNSDIIPNKSTINAYGKVSLFSVARNEGNFDEKKYYNSMGLVCRIENASIEKATTPFFFIEDCLYRLQKRLKSVFEADLPNEEAGFMEALTIGDKSSLEGQLKELFMRVGLAHVLAVSGLHVSFLCMGIFNILRKCGCGYLLSGLSSGLFSILYGIMTGGSVSSKRAIGMFIIYIGAQVLGESYDMLTSLAVMALLLLIENPLYVYNSGFIFSFWAIIGVNLVAKPLVEEYKLFYESVRDREIAKNGIQTKFQLTKKEKIIFGLGRSLTFSVGITLFTLPVVARVYYQIPTYNILVNLIVLPLLPVLLGLGIIGGVVGLFWGGLGNLILFPCHLIIFFFEMLSNITTLLPFSQIITGCPSLSRIAVYLLLICLVVHGSGFLKLYIVSDGWRLKMCLLLICSLVIVVPAKKNFEIDVLDVGQGDGIYISALNGTTLFIDGGSSSENEVGKYRILPFLKYKGVRKIDYWFVSHGDADHMSGLLEVIEEGFKVQNIVVDNRAIETPELLELKKKAKEKQINIIAMRDGDCIKNKNMKLTHVFPTKKYYVDDSNGMSMALLIEVDINRDGKVDFSGFFGGDLNDTQERLIAEQGIVKDVDYLKVSHHGSKNSSDSEFLNRLSPKVATISCAKKNSYGHPSTEAINRLEGNGTRIYYTMESGEITVRVESDGKINVGGYLK